MTSQMHDTFGLENIIKSPSLLIKDLLFHVAGQATADNSKRMPDAHTHMRAQVPHHTHTLMHADAHKERGPEIL